MTPSLPPARTPGQYAVALVCLGNICRSPIADVVLQDRLSRAGLDGRVSVASCGTDDWHVGNRMDRRAAATLTTAGYDPTCHRAQQLDGSWFTRFDLLLAMDRSNLSDLQALKALQALQGQQGATAEPDRARLFRSFDPVDPGGEVPDPYYGGDDGFQEVLAMVERTTDALVAALAQQVGPELERP